MAVVCVLGLLWVPGVYCAAPDLPCQEYGRALPSGAKSPPTARVGEGHGATPSCCAAHGGSGGVFDEDARAEEAPGDAAHPAHPADGAGAVGTRIRNDNDNDNDNDADAEDDEAKEGKGKDKAKWDVNAPPDAYHDVPIDVEEGTWMNVDISPDGRELVFDLLGDIYRMPIEGGEASALTSGIAWDMQPRFSPDGQWIAFTSDRGGGDNIWIMRRDGADPKAVTDEDYRLLNSPAWTPDGQYIVAHKHFTSRRSIGAGEMWLYHRSGGKGVQMTKRPNDQKDVGEPAFSPCGRYLYYSQDVSPGDTFEYNKDPNGSIYAIYRLDRVEGEIERFIHGPGGAVRPTPSPDGRRIAFVRRVRYQTVLFLREVESGREWPIHDDLERDMQETWAIHGVYPTMAWTPDGKSIVLWAGGKIRRINVDDGRAEVIPFHVSGTRQVADAVRFPVQVAPEQFEVRLLQSVEVSPQGDAVVYQALGHIYIRPLPEGTPRRLTRQEDHFEFYPSWSRDGRWIVYTTWDDEELGTVRVVAASGGEGRVLTDRPGHYIEPVFSPDGSQVVYRRVGGGYITSPLWSQDQGVYRVSVDGGPSTRVTRKGSAPQFGAASDRVYLQRFDREGENDRLSLVSIDLDGSDERTELVSDNAREIRLSPDEKWVAFVERFNAYVTPFVRTGREVKLAPKSKDLPTRRVTRDAGQYVHFSGDGLRLHWSLGPQLFTRELRDAFAFLEGAPDPIPEPPTEGTPIGFTADSDRPSGTLAFVGARIITMRGDEVIERGTIVVEGNRIHTVGPSAEVAAPAGARVIDAGGMTIIPGLVDVHDHGPHAASGMTPEQNWSLWAKLAFGVTTVHDPSHDTEAIFASSELARAGLITAPRIFSTGRILYGATGWFKAEVAGVEDAASHLRRTQAVGAISVKSYNQPRRDQRQQVLAAARQLGIMVVPEGGSLLQHNLTMIVDGHTGIEHAIPVAHAYRDVIDLWSATQVGYTPTLVVGYGGLWGENYWYQKTDVWANERLLTFVPRFVVDPRSRRRVMVPEEEFNHIRAASVCKKLVDAGGRVNLGAHGQLAGLAAHWELWMFAQGGMTPLEAIRCSTLYPAWYVGLDADIGSLEPGKLADMVVLTADPLTDIRHTEAIRYVVRNGRCYDAATMNQVHPEPRTRSPFFWERMDQSVRSMVPSTRTPAGEGRRAPVP
jgi:Tol biopolymer transport system component/imidazolonepropionase-like amidohydrolase